MAINVTIARGYAWRMIIIGAACVVLGAWGIYDYAVDIPRRQELQERWALLELCQDALKTEQAAGALTLEAQAAVEAISAEANRIMKRELAEIQDPEETIATAEQFQQKMQQLAESLKSSEDGNWLALLTLIYQGLHAERRLPLKDHPQAFLAFEATEKQLDAIGPVTAPGKYDRVTQWAFILCLPCAPYFFWMYFAAKRRRYTLEDDGTLDTPAGTWKAGEIADIDMSRWMAKSIAWVVHADGSRVKLDDYKFKGLDAIVGAIASRLYPDDWKEDARPLAESTASPETGGDGPDPGEAASGLSEPAAEADMR
ncbi:MAG: hypothetical protein ACYS15_01055 [Planctomycetota bacterium]|jgi:hypothetical protein